jgi:hypothetical protein
MSTTQKWTEDRVETLIGLVGSDKVAEVTSELQITAATALDVSVRSIAAKLRNLLYVVASTATKVVAQYTEAEEAEIRTFVENNAGVFTYAEIANQVLSGTRTAKQIQGKILSMDLFTKVKATPKVEIAKQYSDEETDKVIALMQAGTSLEALAEAMDRPLNSVRGKALSITKSHPELEMPKQEISHAVTKIDVLGDLGEAVVNMTVAELTAAGAGKSERGVKTMLTRRALTCKDYDGAKKAAKNAAAKSEA